MTEKQAAEMLRQLKRIADALERAGLAQKEANAAAEKVWYLASPRYDGGEQ